MSEARVFDWPHYQALDEARRVLLRRLLPMWKDQLGLHTAIDVGCGVGHFSSLLASLGISVTGVDGREGNVEEARRRFPGTQFQVRDVEDPSLAEFDTFDLVLCMGLLYHLENPFRAIRNIRQLTGKFLIVESMCVDVAVPALYFREEGPTEDQGLRHIAFYPTEACLIKMLYRAGFPHVYRFAEMPDHEDFHANSSRRRVRALLAASFDAVTSPALAPVREPAADTDPWITPWGKTVAGLKRVGFFLTKPWPAKVASLRRRAGSLAK